jgi:hypothetical protein
VTEKSHYSPTPCTALWGEGEGGFYLYGPEDLLNKNHQKHTENGNFNENSETKNFVKIFARHF